jgi:hypothetical protein
VKFSKSFTVKGNIESVFELSKRCVSDMKFMEERSIKPTMLVLGRGNISGSLSSFNINDVKTVLTVSFSQKGENVHVRCDYETRYGRLITPRDESNLKDEVTKLKSFLQTTLPKKQ